MDGAGVVKLRFAPEVVPLITRLEKNFTSYELMQVANLNLYSTRLYELLVCWRSTGKTPVIELNDFRARLGLLDNEYKLMHNFKNRVLESAIKQINEHTDIKASYEQHKTGRVITGFSFTFKQRKTSKKNISDDSEIIIKMTVAQRHLFAQKLSEMPEMNKYSQGTESYVQFAVRIADMLQDPNKLQELSPYLKKAGYTPSK